MPERSVYVLETLREGGEFTLYRGRRGDNSSTVLLLALAAEQPSPQSLERLEHEYALTAELEPAWAARPLALTRQEGRTMLVLEDPGGEPLDRVLDRSQSQPLELTRVLRIAIGLASALGRMHRQSLIHKDIKPANVLVDDADNVWLTGFGIASRLPRESQAPAPPEIIAGTLAYMAPEQTGRMNRSIDTRSDLYSLGVTLYEMLTGALPFSAVDPLEWVHCHIARQPAPPRDRAGVPEPLSLLTMKLLAKNAEERYQTASGVKADLLRCLAGLESCGGIDAFPLGTHDASDRLRIPEKLYGREPEIAALLAAFDRVMAEGMPELVLVSGYSGVGKSSVVNELHRALVPPRGLFASGKFEQYKRDIPYATLAQAFQQLVRQILSRPQAQVEQWRAAIQDAVGTNGALLVDLVPELALLIGPQPAVPDLPSVQAQARFQTTFRRFLGVFARAEHPLVLFLDDLQWLDAATLQVLEHLVTHPEVRHLLLIGAYRDNEVSPSHPLILVLNAVRAAGASVQDLVLAPLSPDDVQQLVADALSGAPADTEALASLVHERTGGNPFFAIQFLAALADELLLQRDPHDAVWRADLAGIRAKGFTDNVVDLMVRKLHRLPQATQDALQRLACLGNTATIAIAAMAHGGSQDAMHADLWAAIRDGFLLPADGAYRFLHDRVQEAAYSLIPEGQRAAMHLRIGRLLVARMSPDAIAERLFDVVNQLNLGVALISDRDERDRTAELNLRAGRKAKTSTAEESACQYFAQGMALVGPDVWDRRYDLAFGLWIGRAESEFLTGHLAEALRLLEDLLPRARSTLNQAAVHTLRAEIHVVASDYPKAVDSTLACLGLLGVEMTAHPDPEQVRLEHDREVLQRLGDRSVESLIDLPRMTDPAMLACMRVLSTVIPPAFFTDVHLWHLVITRMVSFTLQHGTTSESTLGFAWYGLIQGPTFRRYAEGARWVKLAADLVDRHAFTEQRARALLALEMATLWTGSISMAVSYIRAAFRVALDTGDLPFACFASTHLTPDLIARGDALDEVVREAAQRLDFVRKTEFRDTAYLIVSQHQFVQAMRGHTTSLSSFNDAEFDEATFEAEFPNCMRTMVCWYWIYRTQAWFLSGDYEQALTASGRAEEVLWSSDAHFQLLDFHYFTALAIAALHDISDARRAQFMRHLAQLQEWAEHCTVAFRDRYLLVSAEAARLEGREPDAMRLYEEAIRTARDHGFIQYEAVAHEVAAGFYGARGYDTIAAAYLRNARDAYRRWGALGKVKHLDERYPHLHEERVPASTTSTIGTPAAQLDVETVVKASQALSSEIVLGKLIETLMRIAVEHAGAERGLLILLRGEEPQIEAEATTVLGGVEVTVRQAVITPSDLPQSALHYVMRTRERVVLDDASVGNLYSEDEYVRAKRARSVLCLPIVKQTKLVGALYLENNLTPRAFTSDRVAVLEMLASQAAISLENALLYADLQQENSDRKQAEARIRRLVESNIIGVLFCDLVGGITEANDAFLQTVGYSRQDLLSGNVDWYTMTPPEYRAADAHAIEELAQSGTFQPFEKEYIRKDGRRVPVLIGGATFEGSSEQGVSFVLDLTQRKKAEAELARSQAHLSEAQRLSHTGSYAWNVASGEIFWSDEMFRIYGFDRTVEPTLELILGRTHPDDRAIARTLVDGTSPDGANLDIEYRLLMPDGTIKYIRSLSGKAGPEFMGDLTFIGTVIDVTERKRAEEALQRSEQRLRQAEKMEAIGRLAGGVAHDFNNILGVILGYGELAQDNLDESGAARRHVDQMMHAGARGKGLVERILAFSRTGLAERVPVHVQSVVEETLELLAASLPTHVRLDTKLDAGDTAVVGEATQFHQMVMNLCTNALHAMERGGVLTVLLDRVAVPERRALSHGTLSPGLHVRLSVSDTGSGIPPVVFERMFDPFFTTKGVGHGTGLGLSLVHGIVAEFGGAIDVMTQAGVGTTFAVWLPAAGETFRLLTKPADQLPHGNGETVMIVDDEPSLVALTEETLAGLGYKPVGFDSSVAALQAFRAEPQRFDLVLTDETMPDLSGVDLARETRRVRPELPVILMSGYSGAQLTERARAVGVVDLLRKPLVRRDIAEALGRALRRFRYSTSIGTLSA